MSAALDRLEEKIAELERAADGVRSATREAHEATKELRLVLKEVRAVLKTGAHDLVKAGIEEAVGVGLKAYADEIAQAQRRAVDHVGKTFEELGRVYLEGKGDGNATIPELVEKRLRRLRRLNEEGPR